MVVFRGAVNVGGEVIQVPAKLFDKLKRCSENEWVAIYFDRDKGVLKSMSFPEKIPLKKAASALLLESPSEVEFNPKKYRELLERRLSELEKKMIFLEKFGLDNFIDEFHTDLFLEYSYLEEELNWIERINLALSSDVEIDGFTRIVRDKDYEMLWIEDTRAFILVKCSYLLRNTNRV